MKNLFKNLMLVAVAAMAFTACTETNDEVNAVSKKTVISGVLNIENDDTRSVFLEKEDENQKFYKSAWEGGEYIRLYFSGGFSDYAEVDAEGNFEIEYIGDLDPDATVTICSPYDAWSGVDTFEIPSEQTPLANSVDPAAHILKSGVTKIENNTISATMNHVAAYGKMTVNAPEGFAINKVEVSFNGGDVYTIKADNLDGGNTFWFTTEPAEVSEFTVTAYGAGDEVVTKTVDMAGKEKPLAFNVGRVSTFSVSGLEAVVAPEPEGLVFTSAAWINTWKPSDKLVKFYTESGATLQLNWYNCGSDAWIVPNTYGFANNYAIYPGGEFSWYEDASLGIDTEIVDGSVMVSVVNGQYYIEFSNMADYGSVVIESATFTGEITGLQVPDLRTTLPKPTNVQVSVSGKTITLTWDAVEGADGYRVNLYSPYDEHFEEIVTTNEYVYEAQLSNTMYSFTIMSYASDTNTQYRSSEDEYAYATTEDTDPKMEVTESALSFSADGGEKTFTVTLKNTDAAIAYTKDGDWFSVDMSGNTFTVTAEANNSETDGREGSITITAGELSQTLDVTQSKKAAEGGDVIEIEIERIYAANYTTDYDLNFYIKNEGFNNILINVLADTYNNSGTYSFAYNGDTSNGFASASTHQYKGTPIDSGTLIVTVDGSKRTFDFTFMVGEAKYHFNFTATE